MKEKVLEHTHARYTRATRHTFLIRKLVRPVFPVMNKPAAVAVLLAMNAHIMLGVGPFVSFLSYHIVPDTAGEWLVEAHDFALFVLRDTRLHRFNCSPGNDAVLCPIRVALAIFVPFPVLAFSVVAAHARPRRVFGAKRPRADRVSGDEGTDGWGGISVRDFIGFDDFQGGRAIQLVLFVLSKRNPLIRGHLAVFGNHPGNTTPRVVSVLTHQRNEVAVGVGIGASAAAAAAEQGHRRRVGRGMARWNRSNGCAVSRRHFRRRRRRRRRDTMKCAECVHCGEILTFGHFVLLVFDDTHQRSQVGIDCHCIFVIGGCVYKTLYSGYCKKSISIFFTIHTNPQKSFNVKIEWCGVY
jgi:hypothetical protein